MRLSQLIEGLDIRCTAQGADLSQIRICDMTEDSRTAVPGSFFIARAGTKEDGCKFIEPAIECGCVAILSDHEDIELPPRSKVVVLVADDVKHIGAILAERFYGNPSKSLIIAGVTGTNGKTTITHLAHQLIESAGIRCGLIGTVEIDDGRQVARASMTTPPAVELSRTLATMVEHDCKALVMEVSSHAMDQARVGALKFDACAFTNLTGDHLDYHQTIEHYANSKSKLFGLLKDDGIAIINVDDSSAPQMIDAAPPGVQVFRCSIQDSASCFVHIEDETIDGMSIKLTTPMGTIHSRVAFIGRYNAMNILQAVLIAMRVMSKIGINSADQLKLITKSLPALKLPSGRLEKCQSIDDDLVVMIDFAHTDDALASSLGAIKAVLPMNSQIWCVFGCGGDRDKTKRPRMGQVVSSIADHVVITSDNPRTEPPNRIIDEIRSGIESADRTRVHVQPDRSKAIEHAILHAAPNDVVLISGKGHETEQILPDGAGGVRVIHFDDREHAKLALRQRRLRLSTTQNAHTNEAQES